MMRAMPYLIKNSVGVWCVERKVPEKLEVAVARVLGGKKDQPISRSLSERKTGVRPVEGCAPLQIWTVRCEKLKR